jgi:hypothetical protein
MFKTVGKMHIRLAPGTTLTNVEGKDVLFSVKTGDSYGLNETAARMLRVGCEADLDEAVDQLAAEYGVERNEIRDDFKELVSELVQLKFVQVVSDHGG